MTNLTFHFFSFQFQGRVHSYIKNTSLMNLFLYNTPTIFVVCDTMDCE